MKIIRIFLLVLIIIGVVLLCTQGYWVPKLVNKILSSDPVVISTVGNGERCGGNMTTAPKCMIGYHCAPAPGSHLPFGDVGGFCVSDVPLPTTTPVLPAEKSAMVKGKVTLSPVCPVERIPPDPACAPKPYATTIKIFSVVGNNLIRTVQTDGNGKYSVNIPFGNYNFQASGGSVYPSCPIKKVSVNSNLINVDISCDTGIR